MMARRGVMGVLAGAAVAVLGGCGVLGGNSYRFKLTVEVETPKGLRTGSSVYEVLAFKTSELITGGTSSDSTIKGEAVAVDLLGGKTLFALLKTANPSGHDDLVYMSMRTLDPAFKYNRVEGARRISSGDGIRSPSDVAPADYPLLVTFRDIRDPASVEKVDPGNLAANFGPGVRLKRITVEVTDEDVTTGIEKRLGWFTRYLDRHLDGTSASIEDLTSDSPSAHMSSRSFSTEIGK